MMLRPCSRDGLTRNEHHIVAIGKDVRQRGEFGSLDHEVLETADAGVGDGRIQLAGEEPLDRTLDLEVEWLTVAGHEIDGLSIVIEEDRADRLRDIYHQVGEQDIEGHQGTARSARASTARCDPGSDATTS